MGRVVDAERGVNTVWAMADNERLGQEVARHRQKCRKHPRARDFGKCREGGSRLGRDT
jgi:hypothetical protein